MEVGYWIELPAGRSRSLGSQKASRPSAGRCSPAGKARVDFLVREPAFRVGSLSSSVRVGTPHNRARGQRLHSRHEDAYLSEAARRSAASQTSVVTTPRASTRDLEESSTRARISEAVSSPWRRDCECGLGITRRRSRSRLTCTWSRTTCQTWASWTTGPPQS